MSAEEIINDLHRSPQMNLQEIYQLLTAIQNINQPIEDDTLVKFILYDELVRAYQQYVRIGQDIDELNTEKRENEIMLSEV